jgi:hypothetical protein
MVAVLLIICAAVLLNVDSLFRERLPKFAK